MDTEGEDNVEEEESKGHHPVPSVDAEHAEMTRPVGSCRPRILQLGKEHGHEGDNQVGPCNALEDARNSNGSEVKSRAIWRGETTPYMHQREERGDDESNE